MNTNPSSSYFAALSLLMLVSGFGIPVMAALNSGLGRHLQSPTAATAALFGIGFLAALMVAALVGLPPTADFRSAPSHQYLGATFMVFYVLAITFTAPRIGIANAIFFVLLGQMIAAAIIDHFGLMGAIHTTLTLRRGVGLALMCIGLFFARRPL